MATRKIDLTGKRFGRLTVIREAPNSKAGSSQWHCVCSCGSDVVRTGDALRAGKATSCGCAKGERNKKNIAGQRFGKLTVICEVGRSKDKQVRWKCLCDCGNTSIVLGNNLRRGNSTSCGCGQIAVQQSVGDRTRTHGMAGTPTFTRWNNMKQRCYNPNASSYEYYGDRGITVCDRWLHSFENFLEDMGECPSDQHSIERIDNNKGYSPENCKWATAIEQGRNRRNVKLIEFEGKKLAIPEWAECTGIKPGTIAWRLARGWSVDRALTTPVTKK
jgi:hypothetical protein